MFAFAMLFLMPLIALISGWSGLRGAIRRSDAPHRRWLLLLAWAPVLSLLIDAVLIFAQNSVRNPSHYVPGSLQTNGHFVPPHMVPSAVHASAVHAFAVILPIVAGFGWLLSVACVAVAARRAQVEPSDLRFGKSVSVVVVVLFAFEVLAYVTMGIGLIVQAREAAHGSFTTISFPHQDLWVPMILVLLIAELLSCLAARAASRSWRVISISFT
jgi:hypothetical protein